MLYCVEAKICLNFRTIAFSSEIQLHLQAIIGYSNDFVSARYSLDCLASSL